MRIPLQEKVQLWMTRELMLLGFVFQIQALWPVAGVFGFPTLGVA